MRVAIVGGGIIGLCSAYYLRNSGYQVTVIDSGDGSDGCSFGNAGYLSPSHFIPLAAPGIVSQGLKYLLNASSPFYIQPRINADLIKWCLKFRTNATHKKVAQNSPSLFSLLQYSKSKTIEMANHLEHEFDLQLKGCYMMYRKEKTAHHEMEMAHEAKKLGIDTELYDNRQLNELEPQLGVKAIGAVFYPIDAHLHPVKWMNALKSWLINEGVHFLTNNEVTEFEISDNKIISLSTDNHFNITADYFVLACGSWLPALLAKLGLQMLLQPGKGYSMTFENCEVNLTRPAILVDDRVAMTPFGSSLRIGGTMELSGINFDIRLPRAKAIVDAVNDNFENINLTMPTPEKIWCGLRPVTPDGLPYISRTNKPSNLVVAGGHAMLGISLAAGTGCIVRDIINEQKPEIDISAFDWNR